MNKDIKIRYGGPISEVVKGLHKQTNMDCNLSFFFPIFGARENFYVIYTNHVVNFFTYEPLPPSLTSSLTQLLTQ